MEHTRKSTIVRAELSEREWVRFRKLALDRNEPSQKIIGGLIRDFLQLHDPEPEPASRRA